MSKWGDRQAGLTRKIKEICKGVNPELDMRAEELCSYFNLIGIPAERSYMEDDFSMARCISLKNSNIDAIEYYKLVEPATFGSPAYYGYRLVYVVKREIGNERKDLMARTKKIRKSLFEKPVDFEWVGGRIADILNQDTALKKSLYDEAGVTYPKEFGEVISITRFAGIYIRPNEGIVGIDGPGTYWTTEDPNPPISIFPPLRAIKAYDKIAKYIKEQVHY